MPFNTHRRWTGSEDVTVVRWGVPRTLTAALQSPSDVGPYSSEHYFDVEVCDASSLQLPSKGVLLVQVMEARLHSTGMLRRCHCSSHLRCSRRLCQLSLSLRIVFATPRALCPLCLWRFRNAGVRVCAVACSVWGFAGLGPSALQCDVAFEVDKVTTRGKPPRGHAVWGEHFCFPVGAPSRAPALPSYHISHLSLTVALMVFCDLIDAIVS
jgi:hypothetical protein